jgi:hypothetical protein
MNDTNENITRCNASTKPSANGVATVTAFTFDWTGMTDADIRAMAQSGLVIKLQSQFRRDAKKNGTAIPATLNVKVTDHKPGTRTVKTERPLIERINELSPDERAALLAQLTAA